MITGLPVPRSVATARKGMDRESKSPRASRLPRSIATFIRALTSASTSEALWIVNRLSPCSHVTSGRSTPNDRGARGR
jgi:hypothetical protein